jgi:bile acid:Na+ symporter, BASS family
VEQGPLIEYGLPAAIFFIMIGMGMTLVPKDFRAVIVAPRATFFGLFAQLLLLPVVAFLLADALSLSPALAVGLVVIAACPGGTTSNLFVYLGRGDLALSIILTVLASLITIVTLPLAVGFALERYADGSQVVALPVTKTVGALIVLILLPVMIGMTIKRYANGFAVRMEKLVSAFGLLVLVGVIVAILAQLGDRMLELLWKGGLAAALLNIIGLAIGFAGSRLVGLSREQGFSVAVELGIKNSTLGLLVTLTLLSSSEMSVPVAVYGVMMFGFGFLMLGYARFAGVGRGAGDKTSGTGSE